MNDVYEEIEELEEVEDSEIEKADNSVLKTWLGFKAGQKAFAIESKNVREILRNNDIFHIPFVPDYIKGVLNYYGKPYAVIDFALLQNDEPATSKLFMIIDGDSDIALQISDIYDFYSSLEVKESPMEDKSDDKFFSAAITLEKELAPVLNIENILAKVRNELEISY